MGVCILAVTNPDPIFSQLSWCDKAEANTFIKSYFSLLLNFPVAKLTKYAGTHASACVCVVKPGDNIQGVNLLTKAGIPGTVFVYSFIMNINKRHSGIRLVGGIMSSEIIRTAKRCSKVERELGWPHSIQIICEF